MKTTIRIATPLIAVALMSGASFFAHAQDKPAPTAQTHSWNTPPPGTEQEQAAYRDGIEAAQLDKAAHRPIDAKSVSSLCSSTSEGGSSRIVSFELCCWIRGCGETQLGRIMIRVRRETKERRPLTRGLFPCFDG